MDKSRLQVFRNVNPVEMFLAQLISYLIYIIDDTILWPFLSFLGRRPTHIKKKMEIIKYNNVCSQQNFSAGKVFQTVNVNNFFAVSKKSRNKSIRERNYSKQFQPLLKKSIYQRVSDSRNPTRARAGRKKNNFDNLIWWRRYVALAARASERL